MSGDRQFGFANILGILRYVELFYCSEVSSHALVNISTIFPRYIISNILIAGTRPVGCYYPNHFPLLAGVLFSPPISLLLSRITQNVVGGFSRKFGKSVDYGPQKS